MRTARIGPDLRLSHTQLCNFQNNRKTLNFVKVPKSTIIHSSSNSESGFELNRGVNKFSRYMGSRFVKFLELQGIKFQGQNSGISREIKKNTSLRPCIIILDILINPTKSNIFENSRKRLAVYTPCAECVLVEIK